MTMTELKKTHSKPPCGPLHLHVPPSQHSAGVFFVLQEDLESC